MALVRTTYQQVGLHGRSLILVRQWNVVFDGRLFGWSSVRENCRSLKALEFEVLVAEVQDKNLSGAACPLESVFVG
jgi:hypothetical protein